MTEIMCTAYKKISKLLRNKQEPADPVLKINKNLIDIFETLVRRYEEQKCTNFDLITQQILSRVKKSILSLITDVDVIPI